MSKQAKDPAPKGEGSGQVAVAEKKTGKVEDALPKGMGLAKDGTTTLKAGFYKDLDPKVYEMHGARMKLEGSTFVADYHVDWIPVKKCVCKTLRTEPVVFTRLPKSQHIAISARCADNKCDYGNGATYLWIQPAVGFKF